MTREQVDKFLLSYVAGDAHPEECALFREWLSGASAEDQEYVALHAAGFLSELEPVPSEDYRRLDLISAALDAADRAREESAVVVASGAIRRLLPFWWAAACGALLIITGLWYYKIASKAPAVVAARETLVRDIAPGVDGAVLTLADGTKVQLDSASNGVIAYQQGVAIKIKSGKVGYDEAANARDIGVPQQYNTLSTPRGRQYRLSLPDGSDVWLNAGSSIRFPVAFETNERRVEVAGEAFFEVAKDAHRPFRVQFSSRPDLPPGSSIEVLGTSFNVNAYTDEPICKVTLVEGSVKVSNMHGNEGSVLLHPSEQASFAGSITMKVSTVNTDRVIAWKNGAFDFEGASLRGLMRQISRWYDVDVVYHGQIPETEFGGKMNRSTMLSEMVKLLNASGVHCRLNGRTLEVMP